MQRIEFSTRKVTRILFTILGILLVLHLTVVFSHLVLHWRVAVLTQLVDLDLEANLPTLFNVSLFFIGAALFFLHGKASKKPNRRGWMLMTAVFLFLGFDEGSQIHEKFELITMRLIHYLDPGAGWLYWAWAIPYLVGGGILALVLARWLLKLPLGLRKGLILSGTVYVFSAVFLEWAGGKVAELVALKSDALFPWMPCDLYADLGGCWFYMDPRYITLYTLEEVGEMTGLILCIHFLMKAFDQQGLNVSLNLTRKEKGGALGTGT